MNRESLGTSDLETSPNTKLFQWEFLLELLRCILAEQARGFALFVWFTLGAGLEKNKGAFSRTPTGAPRKEKK